MFQLLLDSLIVIMNGTEECERQPAQDGQKMENEVCEGVANTSEGGSDGKISETENETGDLEEIPGAEVVADPNEHASNEAEIQNDSEILDVGETNTSGSENEENTSQNKMEDLEEIPVAEKVADLIEHASDEAENDNGSDIPDMGETNTPGGGSEENTLKNKLEDLEEIPVADPIEHAFDGAENDNGSDIPDIGTAGDHALEKDEDNQEIERLSQTEKITSTQKQDSNKNGAHVRVQTNMHPIKLTPGKKIYVHHVTVNYVFRKKDRSHASFKLSSSRRRSAEYNRTVFRHNGYEIQPIPS